MSELILGPLLRYAGETEATVWVETDTACKVEVLGCSSPTFRIGHHHYWNPAVPTPTRSGSTERRFGPHPSLLSPGP
jgi:hypothetical protein